MRLLKLSVPKSKGSIKVKLIERSLGKLIIFILLNVLITNVSASHLFNENQSTLKVATFNVSMDATNYLPKGEIGSGKELIKALKNNRQQIKNIAEIIQRTRPDIILLNEFDYIKDPTQGVELFLKEYLGNPQQAALPIDYPYYYFAPVNTGVSTPFDLNNDGKITGNLADAQGFGHFPGQHIDCINLY